MAENAASARSTPRPCLGIVLEVTRTGEVTEPAALTRPTVHALSSPAPPSTA
ncbi:hypothetical protein ACFYR1_19060 [Streptomyces canus]|uniref:hypothetical protein n=1 Tax=Streptomyces canus TaxID=58343 RepID=UPI003675F1F4